MKRDIENRTDINSLVDAFYARILQSEVLKPYFTESMAVDWEKHLPLMKGFWAFILLNEANAYTGSMMGAHMHVHEKMPLTVVAFENWISIFSETVDALFVGEKAEEAKKAAFQIGATLRYKLLGSSQKGKIEVEIQPE